MNNFLKYTSRVMTCFVFCIFFANTSFAVERLPLDDPWIVFCLKTSKPGDELGRCIDGLPSSSRDILKVSGYEMEMVPTMRLVPAGQSGSARATFVCPPEFGSACEVMVKGFLSVGGSCNGDGHDGAVCHYP